MQAYFDIAANVIFRKMSSGAIFLHIENVVSLSPFWELGYALAAISASCIAIMRTKAWLSPIRTLAASYGMFFSVGI